MKCEVHPDQDALGTCVSCGRGVCAICKVNYQGLVHCKQCVEAGRIGGMRQQPAMPMPYGYPYGYGYGYGYPYPYYYYPPAQQRATPNPRGQPDGRLFRLGSVGCLASGIMSIVAGMALVTDGLFIGYSSGSRDATYIATVLLAFFQVLAGFGFLGFFRNYGPMSGAAAGVMLSISGFLFLGFLGAATLEPGGSFLMVYVGVMILGVGHIIAGASLIDNRKFLDGRDLAMISAILLIIAGGLMAGLIGVFMIGWVAAAIGYFMLAAVFFNAPVPSPAQDQAEAAVTPTAPPGWQY